MNKDVVKVITGIRRSGKSVLLKQFFDILIDDGIKEEQIIYLNFESLTYDTLNEYRSLYNYIMDLCKSKQKYYLLFDEIQKVIEWEKSVASFRVDLDCDIYITGSNAYLLSSEFSTLLSGRSVELHIYPLSFSEYLSGNSSLPVGEAFDKYMQFGGFPGLLELEHDLRLCSDYLEGVFNTVVVKDILSRTKVTNTDLLTRLMLFMSENIGNLISGNKIADYMKSNGMNAHVATVIQYIEAFEKAFILHKARRYDVRGKKVLRSPDKYYLTDIGLRSYLHGFEMMDRGRVLENIVYLELLRRHYKVAIGTGSNYEIDFVATNENGVEYYQVSLSVMDERIRERELKGFRNIGDQHKKTLLTMDYGNTKTEDGIYLENIIEWLLK